MPGNISSRFVPQVGEFNVATTTARAQIVPRIATLASGGFVVVWQHTVSDSAPGVAAVFEVRAQIYNANGAPSGGEFVINANSGASSGSPAVAALPGGGFIATWDDVTVGIRMRAFDAAGTPIGAETTLQQATDGNPGRPDIVVRSDGGFGVAWQVSVPVPGGPSQFDARVRTYDANGVGGAEFTLGGSAVGDQGRPRIAALESGLYVVVWDTRDPADFFTATEVRAQLLLPNGQPIGNEIFVNRNVGGSQYEPMVAALPGGGFAIAWTDSQGDATAFGPDGGYGIVVSIFDAFGELLLDTRANDMLLGAQTQPAITVLPGGTFVVSWTDASGQSDTSGAGIVAREFNADGGPLSGEFLVNTQTGLDQTSSALAALPTGALVAVWRDGSMQGADTSGSGIKADILQSAVIRGTPEGETIGGTAGDDSIEGLGGNDTLFGAGGNDQIDGGEGNDAIYGGSDNDSLFGGDGNDEVSGNDGNDQIEGGDGDDRIDGGAGGDYLLGGAGNDTITDTPGTSGRDDGSLQGGEGDDTLTVTRAPGPGPAPLMFIFGGEGADVINVTGLIDNFTGGDEGDDIITVTGGIGSIDGGLGDDVITATSFNGRINGNAGSDTIRTGSGQTDVSINSALYQDGGRDLIIPSASGGVSIGGFAAGEAGDRVDLSAFGADPFRPGGPLTIADSNGNAVITIVATGRTIVFGSVRAGDLSPYNLGADTGVFAPLGRTIDDAFASNPELNVASELIGADGNDTIRGFGGGDILYGGGGNDRLEGGSGDDRLIGGTGADTLVGGAGNDIFFVDSASDIVVENAGEGDADEIRTSLSDYVLPANVERLTFIGAGPGRLRGDASNNFYTGGSGNDLFLLGQGGDDSAFGMDGNDAFYFGGALTAADRVDGGRGADVVALQGSYAGLTLGAGNLVNVETLSLLTGADTRFGESGANRYGYNLTSIDANVAAGSQLTVNASSLLAGENLTFNGSAETNGSFFIYGGRGTDTLTGGAGADVFFMAEGRLGAGDSVNGGAGADILVLRGDFALTLSAGAVTGIETISLLSASDTRFFGGGERYSYNLTTNDANVAAGATMTVNGGKLLSGETLVFNGATETDGIFRLFGGSGEDSLTGGTSNDLLYGGLGADTLTGGAGADTFRYQATTESTAAAMDRIIGFAAGDLIDLSRIDADTTNGAGNDTFTFMGAGAFTGVAGQLRSYSNGLGASVIEGDVDGDGEADLVIFVDTNNDLPPVSSDFML